MVVASCRTGSQISSPARPYAADTQICAVKRSSISCSADRGKAYDPIADEK